MPDQTEKNPMEVAEKNPPAQEAPEDQEEEAHAQEVKGSNLLSPIGLLMLFLAVVIDSLGLSLLLVGLDDFGVLDILGLILIGGLMFATSGSITVSKGSQKVTKKIIKRLGFGFLEKLVPYLGNAVPGWTIAVFIHLKNS